MQDNLNLSLEEVWSAWAEYWNEVVSEVEMEALQ